MKLPPEARKAHRDYAKYRKAFNAIDGSTLDTVGAIKSDMRAVANRAATALGHSPCRQGDRVECYRCSCSGLVGEKLTGTIYTEACP